MHGGGLTHGVSLVPFAYVTLVEKGTSALVPRLLSKNHGDSQVKALFYLQIVLFYQLEYPYETDSFRQIRVFFADIYTSKR